MEEDRKGRGVGCKNNNFGSPAIESFGRCEDNGLAKPFQRRLGLAGKMRYLHWRPSSTGGSAMLAG